MNGDVVRNSIHYEDKAGHVIDSVGRTFTTDSSETVIYGTNTGKYNRATPSESMTSGKHGGTPLLISGVSELRAQRTPNEPNVP
jgi:hypothetical protein